MNQDANKRRAAEAALDHIEDGSVIGVGTGSTVALFVEALARVRQRIEGAVASSEATEALLREHRIPVVDLNSAGDLPLYIDCLLYTSPSPRDRTRSRMPSSA